MLRRSRSQRPRFQQRRNNPANPIRIVMPFPVGSATDTFKRVLGASVSAAVGEPVVGDNKAGADGAIAAVEVAKAASDGYTLCHGTATGMSFAPTAKKVPPCDSVNNFTPISLVGTFGFSVFSHPDLPLRTIQDFVGYARANPGRINYGTGKATSILATAILDRLLDHAVTVNLRGNSYRLKEKLKSSRVRTEQTES